MDDEDEQCDASKETFSSLLLSDVFKIDNMDVRVKSERKQYF